MQQYHAAKQECPGCLLFFRLGDFYELFFDDAVKASSELEITLTSRRNGKGDPIPMCGVPAHAADSYLGRLLQKGHRVAICDQVETPKPGRGLVKREVVRVLSPGTTSDVNVLKSGENNYLVAVQEKADSSGLAYADLSTGEFRTTELASGEVEDVLESIGATELLRAERGELPGVGSRDQDEGSDRPYTVTEVEPWVFDFEYAERLILDTYGLHNLEGLGIDRRPLAVSSAGALLHYLKETQRTALPHLDRPSYVQQTDWMVLDPVTIRHLELFDPLFQEPRTTLLFALDRTATAMGTRLLRSWLLRPSLDLDAIKQRLETVGSFCRDTIARSELHRELQHLHDMERLLSRIALGSAGPRDVYHLGTSLSRIPALKRFASALTCRRAATLHDQMDSLEDVCQRILLTLAAEPPASIRDSTAIAEGFDRELDELRSIQRDSRGFIARLEQREREATGIESLKVRFNKVFGFFIEVSKTNLSKVPGHYDRKQTLINAERFATPELKELEAKVLDAEDRIAVKVSEIFDRLRSDIVSQSARIRSSASAIAEIDVLRGLSQVAVENDYSQPRFSPGGEIHIEGGRHPVVERMLEDKRGERFIENDVYLDQGDRLVAIITGPNMGGKSTYLRQTALIALMAQAGSFVPARKAVLPLVDRIFTRIGASDNVALGRSTFMVEMTETAQILNLASERSLILLDEIGRGTATYDGLAIAWAVVEHILAKIRAKTLFATHYHELTALPANRRGVFNLHVSARQAGDRLVFLRRIQPGNADRSYGIEVAKLAGLPQTVVDRAAVVLAQHERASAARPGDSSGTVAENQTSIFANLPDWIEQELRSLDIETLSPLEAISLLHEWKSALED